MRLLVLGGTQFVGRHIVETALSEGHAVAVFHRGRTNTGLWPGIVEDLIGDRADDLTALEAGDWDTVIDTSGYFPGDVRKSVQLLRERVGFYAFVSTISVYESFARPQMDESGPLQRLEDENVREVTAETYGGLKVLCEREVQAAYDNALIVRPGFIVGPHDHTDRFTYWVDRIARGGRVASPGPPDAPVQFIDVRDLATWIVWMAEEKYRGTYNAVGPGERTTMLEWFEAIRSVTGSDAELIWVDEEELKAAGVEEKMPIWAPQSDPSWRYTMDINPSRARGAGLLHRPIEETIRDTLDWFRSNRHDGLSAGITKEEEAELLNAHGKEER